MALYKDGTKLNQSNHAEFDAVYKPGTIVANSGIYRCRNCGDEIAADKGNPLPPQNRHQHPNRSAIEWQMLVFAQQQQ